MPNKVAILLIRIPYCCTDTINMQKRNLLLILLTFFCSNFVYGLEINTVGPCWVGKSESKSFAVASFSDQTSFEFDFQELEEFVKQAEKEWGTLQLERVDLHCGAYGARLFTTWSSPSNHSFYCLKFKMTPTLSIEVGGPAPSIKKLPVQSACQGVERGTLLLLASDPNQNWADDLKKDQGKKMISEWIQISPKVWKLILTDGYWSRENEVFNYLKTFEKEGKIDGVEYQYWFYPIGDFFLLE